MPCSLQFFCLTVNVNYSIAESITSPLYWDHVNNMFLLIFQLTFVQDSQMLLLPQVLTIVTWFLDMTWCVQFMKIISTYANTGKGWLHQTLQPEVWIYAARMIRNFFLPLTAAIWLKIYTHLKIIFNEVYPSHLPVTWENILI